ncbi:MAG: hypothetical protein K1X78_18765 [Verrucomicrobiaceae bacterium]|nr:hypothetical protein [Verrucomicrobiaceae bacterium]
MFDTIHASKPLICPGCGAEIRSLQTKEFDSVMAHIKLGSVVSGSSVMTGIVKDSLWCEACFKAGKPSDSPVYLVIWHSVLAGVEQDLAKAEARLSAVDRLDLIGWLDEAQRDALRWQQRYWHLYRDVSRWHQHLTHPPEADEPGENAARQRAFRRIFSLSDEILQSPDPLAAILAANKHDDEDAQN